MDIFEIYDEGFNGCKRLLKNGKAINEFGMMKEVKKRDREIALMEEKITRLEKDLSDWNDDFGGL